jgi:hypothetical protein
MQRQQHRFLSIAAAVTCAIFAFSAVAAVQAQEKKADPTGTWTWSAQGRQGGTPRQTTLKLKVEGDKLTGTVTTPGRQGAEPRSVAIENGKVKGDEISFTVTREFNNNRMTQKYVGKVAGDTIKGKTEFERNGEVQSRDWEAKRAAEKPAQK